MRNAYFCWYLPLQALQICSQDVDLSRDWLNRNHPKGSRSKPQDIFAKFGRFIKKQRKKRRRKKMDEKRLNAKRALQMQMKRFDKSITMKEFEKLMVSEGVWWVRAWVLLISGGCMQERDQRLRMAPRVKMTLSMRV